MKIDYEVTEREFIDAVLAAGQARRAEATRADRWRERIVVGVGLGVFVAALLFLAAFWLDEGRRAFAAEGWAPLYRWAGRYEWLLPYVAYNAIVCGVAVAAPRGLAALRWLTAAFAALLTATMMLVAAAAVSGEPGQLQDFGALRWVPWLAPAITLATPTWNAWATRPFRRAYATSPYAHTRASLTIDDAGITSEMAIATTTWRWSAFASVRRARGLTLLMLSERQIGIILPDRAVGTPAEADTLADVLATRLTTARRGFAIEPHSGA